MLAAGITIAILQMLVSLSIYLMSNWGSRGKGKLKVTLDYDGVHCDL